MITLRNDLHGTFIEVLPGIVSPDKLLQIKRALCTSPECTCSDALGARGPQDAEIRTDRRKGKVIYCLLEIKESRPDPSTGAGRTYSVFLPNDLVVRLRKLGDGKLSDGIRRAAEIALNENVPSAP